MAAKKVFQYETEWNIETKVGHIRFKYEDGSKYQWQGDDKLEFTLILHMLLHDTDPYIVGERIVATGPEEAGRKNEVE